MSVLQQPGASAPGLVTRIQNIILRPRPEWEVIDGEPTGVGALFTGYAVPLAAIPAVCQAIGAIVFGYGGFGITIRPSPVSAIAHAVVAYVLSLVGVFVLSLVVNALAPSFNGVKDQRQATKVVVYASTASWLAGVFFLIPMLGVLSILGLYSLYLMYLGLPRLMKTPAEKAMPYLAVTIVCAIVVYFVVGVLATAAVAMGGVGLMRPAVGGLGGGTVSGTINVPGAGSVDLGKLQAASAAMEASARQAQASAAAGGSATVTVPGAVTPVSTDALRALIPAAVAGYPRTEISSGSGGVGGLNAASADGKYVRGDASIDLTVADMGAMAGLGALAGALNVQSDKQTAHGYEKMGRVDGRMTTEEWDDAAKTGKYSVMVSDRYMVEAEGRGASMADLKGAVAAVAAAAGGLPKAR